MHQPTIFSFVSMRALGLAVLLILFLSTCGHKGPLYLPQNEPAKNGQEKP
jgi:predicted small lipoprotein YifL